MLHIQSVLPTEHVFSSLLCRYRLYIGSIAAHLQCVCNTTPDYPKLANHMPQYYIVSYSISMLMSTRDSPIVPYSTTLPSTKSLDISWGSSIVPCGISSIFSLSLLTFQSVSLLACYQSVLTVFLLTQGG